MGTNSNKSSGYFPTDTIIAVEPPKRGSGVMIENLLIDFQFAAAEQDIEVYFGEEVRNYSFDTLSRNTVKNFKGPSRLYRIETGEPVGAAVKSLEVSSYSLADAIIRMTVLVREGQFAVKDDIPVTICLTRGKDGKSRTLQVRRDTTISGTLNMVMSETHDYDHANFWRNTKGFIVS